MQFTQECLIGIIGASIVALIGVGIFAQVLIAKDQIQEQGCQDSNCNVNYNGSDCLKCSNENKSDMNWIIVIIPFASFIVLFLAFSGFGTNIFSGLGGRKPSDGNVGAWWYEELRKEDGWVGIGDFKQ